MKHRSNSTQDAAKRPERHGYRWADPFLYEIIAGSMWPAMGWVCDQRPNAVIDSFKEVFQVEKFSKVACHAY